MSSLMIIVNYRIIAPFFWQEREVKIDEGVRMKTNQKNASWSSRKTVKVNSKLFPLLFILCFRVNLVTFLSRFTCQSMLKSPRCQATEDSKLCVLMEPNDFVIYAENFGKRFVTTRFKSLCLGSLIPMPDVFSTT